MDDAFSKCHRGSTDRLKEQRARRRRRRRAPAMNARTRARLAPAERTGGREDGRADGGSGIRWKAKRERGPEESVGALPYGELLRLG